MDEIGLEKARTQLGEIVDLAAFAGQPTIITRQGKPRAVLVSHSWFSQRAEAQSAEEAAEQAAADALERSRPGIAGSSFHNPLALIARPDGHVRVYEEAPGSLTISYSRDGSMWTGMSIPPEFAGMLTDAIASAIVARSPQDTSTPSTKSPEGDDR